VWALKKRKTQVSNPHGDDQGECKTLAWLCSGAAAGQLPLEQHNHCVALFAWTRRGALLSFFAEWP